MGIDAASYLTVGELREILDGLDPSLPVILQSDAVGNGYRLAACGEDGNYYDPETAWSGTVYLPEEVAEFGSKNSVPCFVIWPLD